jgi:predicted neuraminidase
MRLVRVIIHSVLTYKILVMIRKYLVFTAVFLISAGGVFAQKTNPWRKGIITDEFVYEKAPFPECHAATIAEISKGKFVAAWFGGTKERNPDVGIWVSRNINGKWSAPVEAANGVQNDTLRYPTWNPVLYQVPRGDLILFYKIGPKPSEWKGFFKTSKDGGITWSKQQALPEGYIGPVKNKPVLLDNGTLVSPSSTEGKGWHVHFEATKDFGKTWSMVGPIDTGRGIDAIQPSILKYKGGKLQILARSRNRAIAESWSYDNGKTWSPLEKTNLPNNNSGTDAVTLKDGRQLLVYNHVLPPGNLAKGPRTPLNVAISKDGKNWFAALILEDSPISQYSYPAVIQSSDGLVHFIYTWRRQRIKHVVVDPAKLTLLPIRNGEWPMVKGYQLPVIKESSKDL